MQKGYFELNGNLYEKKIGNSTLLSFSVQNYFYHYNYVYRIIIIIIYRVANKKLNYLSVCDKD